MEPVSSALSFFCIIQSLPGPPHFSFQKLNFHLWDIDKRRCDRFDVFRDTIFYLYKRDCPDSPRVIIPNVDESVWKSEIDFSLTTIMYFHGYVESYLSEGAQSIKNAYLDTGNYNVILVQNARLLAGPNYFTAADNCKPIGRFCASFIDYLVYQGLNLDKLHVIGLSLGAHIAGLTGMHVTTGKIARITGLDPAGPLFNIDDIDERLDASDARFVDVIYTNSGIFGMKYPVGHVNFYPNGGRWQPGCNPFRVLLRHGISKIDEFVFCHHYRSYKIYIKTIRSPTVFPSIRSDSHTTFNWETCHNSSVVYMGIAASPNARGNYYIDTKSLECPEQIFDSSYFSNLKFGLGCH